jgi:hypothetical protein
MRLRHIQTGWMMTAKELFRSRIAFILFFIIPTLFYAVIFLVTTQSPISFKLGSISEETFLTVKQRSEALIFIGLAAVGILTSFLALNLTQKHAAENRRLVLCGFQTSEILLSKYSVLLSVIVCIGGYVGAMLPLFFAPRRFLLVLFGFMMGGYVYGCYGMLIGAIFKRELEGILFIVLLANFDVGWLQNPIYYAQAQNKAIIRHLPGFFPSQLSMISAFTDHSVLQPLLGSLAYGTLLLLGAMLIFWWKMRIRK